VATGGSSSGIPRHPTGFMPAYREVWPVDPGYEEVRRDVYQLYYLLAHVNLFGRGYMPRAMAAVQRVLGRTWRTVWIRSPWRVL